MVDQFVSPFPDSLCLWGTSYEQSLCGPKRLQTGICFSSSSFGSSVTPKTGGNRGLESVNDFGLSSVTKKTLVSTASSKTSGFSKETTIAA